MLLRAIIVKKADDGFGAVLQNRKAMNGSAVTRCKHDLSPHIFSSIILILRAAPTHTSSAVTSPGLEYVITLIAISG